MAFVGTFFAAAGRLSVRLRWVILLAWVAGVAAAMVLLPSLSSVTQSDNTSFLPASARCSSSLTRLTHGAEHFPM